MFRFPLVVVGVSLIVAQFAAVASATEPDGLPTGLESQLCSRAAFREVVETVPQTGECRSHSDYYHPALANVPACQRQQLNHESNVTGATTDADCDGRANDSEVRAGCDPATPDTYPCRLSHIVCLQAGDDDRIPDCHEWVVCLVEDQSDPADGTCRDGDYTPPQV